MRALITGISLALCVSSSAATVGWHEALSYGGGNGFWNLRVPVEVDNPLATPLEGVPVQIAVGTQDGTAALIGTPVASLRVALATGAEVVFDLQDAQGNPKRTGALVEGDVLVAPVEAAANSTATLYLYAGNAQAWLPPEWLHAGLYNGGFEAGTASPENWSAAATDATHRMALDRETFHDGAAAARCDVDAGAEASWVKYTQDDLPVEPGCRYRFSAWVKGRDVVGKAGWFVHVNGDRPQLINNVMGADGTFDWREVSLDFTVPEGGRAFRCGTVLYGAGTAWYDDARLDLIEGGGTQQTPRVLPAERCDLARSNAPAAWPESKAWTWRVPLHIRNVSDQTAPKCLVTCDARRLGNRLSKMLGFGARPRLRIEDSDQTDLPALYAGSLAKDIQCATSLPGLMEKTLWLYISADADAPGQSREVPLSEWASGPLNILKNGGMEEGTEKTATNWNTGEEGLSDNGRYQTRRVHGGIDGNWCLELTVPASVENPGWVGWRQQAPVLPSKQYVLSGYVKVQDVDAPVAIHGHFLRADGTLAATPFFSTQPASLQAQGWQPVMTLVTTPPDCATLEVHLTMNGHGTLWHDGVLLTEAAAGTFGEIESRTPQGGLAEAWVENPLVKVFREDLPPRLPVQRATCATARNASEPFQIVVRATQDIELTVTPSALTGPDGATLDAPTVYRVGYVPIDFPVGYDSTTEPAYHRFTPKHRGNDGWAGWWPDPLIPVNGGTVPLEAGKTQPLWFDLHVPAAAAPGRYQGVVALRAGDWTSEISVECTVWQFEAPDGKHVPAIYDLRNGRGWDIFAGSDHSEMVRKWYRFLAQYNVSPGIVYPEPEFTYQDGKVVMDATRFDAAASYLLDELHVSMVYTPGFFYACGWAYQPKDIFGLKAFTPEYVAAWTDAYKTFIDHVTERGWRNKFCFYLSDEPFADSEPTITGLAHLADMAREIAPDVPIYSSTWHYIEGLAGHLTLWGAGPQGSFDAEKMATRQEAGDRFWFTTDGQMCTDTPLLAIERLLPWFCFRYGVEAYEFWGVSWWTYNPWQQGWHTYIRQSNEGKDWYHVRYPNGDGFLAYPAPEGAAGEPQPSIRLMAARDGVDDYEVFLALKSFANPLHPEVQEMLDRVCGLVEIPNPGGRFSTSLMPDPGDVQATRRLAGELLNRLTGQAERLKKGPREGINQ